MKQKFLRFILQFGMPRIGLRSLSGQMIVVFVVSCTVIFLFMGMAIDFGLMYLDKARLSRAVDAVSLKLANTTETNMTNVGSIVWSTMQANFPGFLDGIYNNSNNTFNAGTFSFSPSNFSAANVTNTLTLTNNNQFITITMTNATPTNAAGIKISGVSVQAQTPHKTSFLRIAHIDQVNLSESSEADRKAKVCIIVLDTSGSMQSNGGASGLPGAVADFLTFLNNESDYVLLVTFSNMAQVVWPTTPYMTDNVTGPYLGMPYYPPSTNFLYGGGGTNTNASEALAALMTNHVSFGNTTCGADGFRLGAEMLQKWLDNNVDPALRTRLIINYILFTDGDYNSERCYVKGRGYGVSLTNNNVDMPASRLSVHNTFHVYQPLIGTNLNITFEGQNLTGIYGSYNSPTNMPGINAVIYAYYGNIALGNSSSSNGLPNKFTTRSNQAWPTNWSGQLVSGNDSGTNGAGLITNPMPAQIWGECAKVEYASEIQMPSDVYCPIMTPTYGVLTNASNSVDGAPYTVTNANPLGGGVLYYPAMYTNDGVVYYPLNTSTYNYYYTNTNARYSVSQYNYFPWGRYWMNNNATYIADSSSGTGAATTSKSWYYTNGGNTYFSGSARVSDYYLDYSIGGPAETNGSSVASNATFPNARGNGDGFLVCANNMTNWCWNTNTGNYIGSRTNSTAGGYTNNNYTTNELTYHSSYPNTVTKFWSFSHQQWQTVNNNNITNDAYWLNRAQAYLARSQQGATIYTVLYGSPGSVPEMQMALAANDPTQLTSLGTNAVVGQPYGTYFNSAQNAAALDGVFRAIGLKISTILTQ